MTSYYFYSDPGHGWLKVPIDKIKELVIEDRITNCSYVKGSDAFLEEDLDAGVFVKALENSGETFSFTRITEEDESIIRSYKRFNPNDI